MVHVSTYWVPFWYRFFEPQPKWTKAKRQMQARNRKHPCRTSERSSCSPEYRSGWNVDLLTGLSSDPLPKVTTFSGLIPNPNHSTDQTAKYLRHQMPWNPTKTPQPRPTRETLRLELGRPKGCVSTTWTFRGISMEK